MKSPENKSFSSCPSLEALIGFAEQPASSAEHRALLDHVDRCARCAVEIELARAFVEDRALDGAGEAVVRQIVDARRPRGGRVGEPRRSSWRPAPWALLAATLLVAAAAYLGLPRLGQPPAVPDGAFQGLPRGGGVRQLAPRGSLSTPPVELRWDAYADADSFLVEILGVDDRPLFSSTATGTALALPAGMTSTLQPHVSYRWRIQPLAADQQPAGPATSSPFKIVPPTPATARE